MFENAREKMVTKNLSQEQDVSKSNKFRNNVTRVRDYDSLSYLNESIWNPGRNMQKAPLGNSQLTLDDSLVNVMQNLWTPGTTTVLALGDDTDAEPYKGMSSPMPKKIASLMMPLSTNKGLEAQKWKRTAGKND